MRQSPTMQTLKGTARIRRLVLLSLPAVFSWSLFVVPLLWRPDLGTAVLIYGTLWALSIAAATCAAIFVAWEVPEPWRVKILVVVIDLTPAMYFLSAAI